MAPEELELKEKPDQKEEIDYKTIIRKFKEKLTEQGSQDSWRKRWSSVTKVRKGRIFCPMSRNIKIWRCAFMPGHGVAQYFSYQKSCSGPWALPGRTF